LRRAIVRTQAERDRELAAADGLFGGINLRLAASSAMTGTWADEERIRTAMSDDDRLTRTFRVYVKGGIEPIPVWLLGDLVEVLGAGVTSVALRAARREEGDDTRVIPYFQALEAEVALAQGDERRAQSLATASLESLPGTEQLLRARVMALSAVAAQDRGQNAQALAFYAQVLQTDGSVIRRLGLSIPARVQVTSGGELAERAGDMLERSPRFDDAAGFTVRVTAGAGPVVSACLLDVHGARVGCAEVDPDALAAQYEEALAEYRAELDKRREEGEEVDDLEPPERPDPARTLFATFHDRIFSAPITLSSADLTSLDGRTTTGGEAAREQMRNLLDQAMNPPP
jgi:hypothetical protein